MFVFLLRFKLIFAPDEHGTRSENKFPMSKYDWSSSDGLFKKLVGLADEKEWVVLCNDYLEIISGKKKQSHPAENEANHNLRASSSPAMSMSLTKKPEEIQSTGDDGAENNTTVKRNLNKIESLTIPSKRQRSGQQELTADERHKSRIEECRIGMHLTNNVQHYNTNIIY